jgi:hypothetical protein
MSSSTSQGESVEPAHRIRLVAVRTLAARRLGIVISAAQVAELLAKYGRADVALTALADSRGGRNLSPELVEISPPACRPTTEPRPETAAPSPAPIVLRVRSPSAQIERSRGGNFLPKRPLARAAGTCLGLAVTFVALGLVALNLDHVWLSLSGMSAAVIAAIRAYERWHWRPALTRGNAKLAVAHALGFAAAMLGALPTCAMASTVGGGRGLAATVALYAMWIANEVGYSVQSINGVN